MIITTIFLALIQATTEFLPISSSGHLILMKELFHTPVFFESLSFDIILHFGTLIALFLYFAKDIKSILKEISRRKFSESLFFKIVLATIPAVFIGFFFGDLIDEYLRTGLIVAFNLFFIGVLFIYSENKRRKEKNKIIISTKDAVLIGVAQTLALIPGISRSGITISIGLLLGLKREDAARFSFLLAIPAISLVSLKGVYGIFSVNESFSEIKYYILGFFLSAIASFIVIKFLMNYLKNNTLKPFAYYRFILAALFIAIMFC